MAESSISKAQKKSPWRSSSDFIRRGVSRFSSSQRREIFFGPPIKLPGEIMAANESIEYLTSGQVSKILNRTITQVQNYRQQGKLKGKRLGRFWLFDPNEVKILKIALMAASEI